MFYTIPCWRYLADVFPGMAVVRMEPMRCSSSGVLVLRIFRTNAAVRLIVPVLSRILPTGPEIPGVVAAHWFGSNLVLSLPNGPKLALSPSQKALLDGYLKESKDTPLLLTDHNHRFRTWVAIK